jgi:peptide-methionine (R)-S-oxide reductase
MKKTAPFIIIGVVILIIVLFLLQGKGRNATVARQETGTLISGEFDTSKSKSDEEWKQILSPEQYHILRESGTETPFTGALNSEKRKGTYYSVGCETPLFRSEAKFDSGTGWPSFWEPITKDAVVLRSEPDGRIEVLDPCGGHLGHVFDDGPPPTGKRYCMNSIALKFAPDTK